MRQFTTIHDDFSTIRRLPRLGKIRLGVKKVSAKSGKEYPADVDYLVCPPEVVAIYGPEPKEVDVMFASEDIGAIFPQKLACYKSNGLWCHGDALKALRYDEQTKDWKERDCPCEHRKTNENPAGDCDEVAHLMVVLPKVSMGGVYQISTRSFHGVVGINSSIDYIRFLVGRVSWVPLKLRRVPQDMKHDGKRITKHVLQLVLDADIAGINALREGTKRILESARYQIEAPKEEPPSADAPDMVVDEEPEEVEAKREQPAPPPPAPEPPKPQAVAQAGTAEEKAELFKGETPEDPYPLPSKAAEKKDLTEKEWELFHNDATNYAAQYVEACKKMRIPEGKPINRAMRNEFRRVFMEILQKEVKT